MKPPPFRYHAPTSVAETLDVLAEVGDEGKLLAGGQSLIPLLNFRLASPAHLVDINRVADLDGVEVADGNVRVGATARQAAVEGHRETARACPLVGQALRLVAHPVVRNRGTVCGSIAHADPAGELTAVLAVLAGTVQVRSRGGEREIGADGFFVGPLESCLRPDELVTSVTFPALPAGSGSAFAEVARRHGDYALCGVAAVVGLGEDGRPRSARTAYISVGPTPVVLDLDDRIDGSDWSGAAAYVRDAVEPEDDLHASAAYRRHLAGVLTERALRDATEHAASRASVER